MLPGDRKDALWTEYLPFAELPQVENPPSGFVFSCNGTPFSATAGEGNPARDRYPPGDGIERTLNNRSLRSLTLFGKAGKISREEFLRFKFDRTHARSSRMFEAVIDPLLRGLAPRSEAELQALDLLKTWDGEAGENSRAAALAILTFKPLAGDAKTEWDEQFTDPERALREAIQFLEEHYGHLDVPLGEVQRLRRGSLDLPLGGGPDVLNAAYTRKRGGHLVGTQGDSYILIAEFGRDGVSSRSIHQYGSSNRPGSPHHADQAPLFVRRELKPALRTEPEIRAQLEREYAPGEEAGTDAVR